MAEKNLVSRFEEQLKFAVALRENKPKSLTNRENLLLDDISRIHRAGLILTKVIGFSSVKNISYVSGIPEQRVRHRLKHPYLELWIESKTVKRVKKIIDDDLCLYLPPRSGRRPKDEKRIIINRPMVLYSFHDSPDLIQLLIIKMTQQHWINDGPRDKPENIGNFEKAYSRLTKSNIITLYDQIIESIKLNPETIIDKKREDIKMWERTARLVKLVDPDRADKIKLRCKFKSYALDLCEEIDFPYEEIVLCELRAEKEFFEAVVDFTSDASIIKAIKAGDILDWKLD